MKKLGPDLIDDLLRGTQMTTSAGEELALDMAPGDARVTGRPRASVIHDVVGPPT